MKSLSMMLVFWVITLFVSVCSAGTAPLTTEKDAREIVTKAYQNFHKLQNYHMTIDAVTSFAFQGHHINVVTKGEGDAQLKRPMLIKNTMIMTMTMDDGVKKNEQKMEQYAEEVGDQWVVYTKFNDQWVKQLMPNFNQLHEYDNYFTSMTRVTPMGETDDSKVFAVTVDGRDLKENMERVLTAIGMQKIKLTDDLFKNVDDITYTITIDKKSAMVSKMEVDLSKLVASIGRNLVATSAVPAEQKPILAELFENMQSVTTISFSQFNKAEKITIPEKVKTESREWTAPGISGNDSRVNGTNTNSEIALPKAGSAPAYPVEARKNNWQGTVILRILVSAQGTIEYAIVSKSSGYQVLDDAALQSVKNWRFNPAKEKGKPIACFVTLPVRFSLQDAVSPFEEMKITQRKLNELGFDCGEPDGVMGPKTKQAIKDFQKSQGLVPDGIVGSETKEALGI